MENKKSFLLYCDLIHTVKKMPPEKAGELFLTILEYVNDTDPNPTDMAVDLVFETIKQQLKRDLVKWGEIKVKRSDSGRKGGLAKQANARSAKQNLANQAVSVSVSVNDSVINKEFSLFWDTYHSIITKSKTDKEPALKHWKKLNVADRDKAIENIEPYSKTNEHAYLKKARTYLADRAFDDEMPEPIDPNLPVRPPKISPEDWDRISLESKYKAERGGVFE